METSLDSPISASVPVLIVEDEPLVRAKLVQIVRAFSEVQALGSVSEVRKASVKGRWACAILDIGLPDGTGWDALRAVREAQPDLSALVLTGGAGAPASSRALLEGVVYLQKPFEPAALRTFVAGALERGRVLQRPTPDQLLGVALDDLTTRYHLSVSERGLLRGRLIGRARGHVSDGHRVSSETERTHYAHIREKTGMRIAEVMRRLLQHVFGKVE